MKAFRKITTFFLVGLLPLFVAAQNDGSYQQDEAMDLFLLIIGGLFMAAMLGSAIIGAFLAAFAILLFFSITTLGLVSTSVAIGLYKRSFTAGFKSFFLILFGITAAVLGAVCILLFNLFIPLPIPSAYLLPIGFFGGLAGGLLLGKFLFYLVKELIAAFAHRLKIT